MKQEKITEIRDTIKRDYRNTAGIHVQKNGQKVYEDYFNDCTSMDFIHVFSVTKSILSILIGIAIDKGDIKNVEQKILDFFPEYQVMDDEETIKQLTIQHLLTMTAPYKQQEDPYQEYFTSSNWVDFALDLLGGPGKIGDFRYTPLIGPDILSGILAKATGRSVLDYANEYLFSPLEIIVEKNIVFHSEAEQFAFYQAKDISGWVADLAGINAAGWGLTLKTEDMAKIGQLYLDKGLWKNQQIVSAKWIHDSTREHSRWDEAGLAYGYLWWVIDEQNSSFAAMGDGGNVIYVNSKKQLVVAISGLFVEETKDRIEFIETYIEPLFSE